MRFSLVAVALFALGAVANAIPEAENELVAREAAPEPVPVAIPADYAPPKYDDYEKHDYEPKKKYCYTKTIYKKKWHTKTIYKKKWHTKTIYKTKYYPKYKTVTVYKKKGYGGYGYDDGKDGYGKKE